jgi:hypothetical protein
MIILSEATTFSKVRMPGLVFAKADIDTNTHQCADQPITAIVPVGNYDIARLERAKKLLEERRLARPFAFVTAKRRIDESSRCKRD